MMTNVGVIDRVFRLALGIALLAWSRGRFRSRPTSRICLGSVDRRSISGRDRAFPLLSGLRYHRHR